MMGIMMAPWSKIRSPDLRTKEVLQGALLALEGLLGGEACQYVRHALLVHRLHLRRLLAALLDCLLRGLGRLAWTTLRDCGSGLIEPGRS